jgi:ribonuclease P protein component
LSLLLPDNERLRKSSVFQRAYTGRKNVNTRLVTLYVVPRAKSERKAPGSNSSFNATRMPFVGFVAAKKVLKSAVARNRVKRRVREAYRLLTRSLREGHCDPARAAIAKTVQNTAICTESKTESAAKPQYKLGQWYVLVFVLHAAALEASWADILKAVDECLNKAEHKYGVMRGGEPGGKPRE